MAQRKIWSNQEDNVLKHLVQVKNLKKWSLISNIMTNQFSLFQRNGKQCRQRYLNHLAADINKEEWSQEQQQKLIQLHNMFGNKWSLISKQLKGRTDNCVKNHFYAKLRKCLRQINHVIESKLKKQFKPLKIDFIYKLVEFADEKYKQNPLVKAQIFQESYQIQNKILSVDKMKVENTLEQNLQKIIELIKQINLFNRKNKKKLKKRNKKQILQQLFDDISSQPKTNKLKTNKIPSFQVKQEQQEYSESSVDQYKNQIIKEKEDVSSQFLCQNKNNQMIQQDSNNQQQGDNFENFCSQKGNMLTMSKIFEQYNPQPINKKQIGRLHSLSIEKQEEFKIIVNNISESQKQIQNKLFNRIDSGSHQSNYLNAERKEEFPNILMEGEVNSQMKTSRLRSFGSIQASVEYHNNSDSKFLDKQFLSKNQLEVFLASLNAPNI